MTDQTGGDGALGAGSSFAGLRIERVLGRGGAGVVYLAHDAELNRRVALKILRASVAADDVRADDLTVRFAVEDLHKTFGFTSGEGFATGCIREFADLELEALFFRRTFR